MRDSSNLNGKTFRATANSSHGTLNTETKMIFSEDPSEITAVYAGGTIRTGFVVGRRNGDFTIEMLYQCITVDGELKAGQATASFAQDPVSGETMHLNWQWLTGDREAGESDWALESD